MTIFDSIKYPISDEIPYNDIWKVPEEIRKIWYNHPKFIYYQGQHSNEGRRDSEGRRYTLTLFKIRLLRKIILEYNAEEINDNL